MNKVRVLIFSLFLLSAEAVFGCMCAQSSIPEMYENSDAVVTAEVIGVKPATVYEDRIIDEGGDQTKGKPAQEKLSGQAIQIRITDWFKGANRKQILNLAQPNTSCNRMFGQKDLNTRLLLYLRFDKKYNSYQIITCGRSTAIKNAANDISWLKGLPGSLNRTRISGAVRLSDETNLFPAVGGIKIKITGNGRDYELFSDPNGVYEIWDLPAGKYIISAEIPEDKQLAWTTALTSGSTDYSDDDKSDAGALTVYLKPNGNAGIDFMLKSK